MNETGLVHPLVAGYLRQFGAAASILPVPRARELREQVAAHIDEAVGPEASGEEIAAVLHDLGSPGLLVAEAVATTGKRSGAAGATAGSPRRRLRRRIVRRFWEQSGSGQLLPCDLSHTVA
jgi:hypothetical protein